MRIGYVGLGRMGLNMVLRLTEQGIEVVAWNRSPEPRERAAEGGAIAVEEIEDLIGKLDEPRFVWLMLPAGDLVDEFIEKLMPKLASGDLIVDGGNSFYKDSMRRAQTLGAVGIHFADVGVSGGPRGAREGACLMIGASDEDFARIEPVAKAAAAPDAYAHVGPVGAGHFVKMVHNGIEYGMMEALAEGAAVLAANEFKLNLSKVFDLYNHRSVIESRLVGWAKDAFDDDENLIEISSKIDHTGEGEWTIKAAQELGVEIPVIAKSFQVRVDSTAESENFRDKVVSALRGKFGQHDVKRK